MANYSYTFTQADGAPIGWTVHTGGVVVVSNALVLTADTTTDLATADAVLTRDNYVLEADITTGASYGGGQRIGLVMHFQDAANYYYVWVKTGLYGGVYLYRYKAYASTLIASDPSAGSRNIPNNTTFNLRVACSNLNGNPSFEVFLNDVSLFSYTDSSDPISSTAGKIGVNQISTAGDNATIDNVSVVEGQATPVITITEEDATVMAALGETTYDYTFNATATDEEDGDLTASISWRYRTDGGSWTALGTGASVSQALPIGVNEVEASVTDSQAATTTEVVTITVQAYAFGGTVPLAGGFIAGDAGQGHTSDTYTGDGVKVHITQQPSNARVFVKHDGSLVVFPIEEGVTEVTFKYRLRSQGGFSNEATITLTAGAPACPITLEDYSGLDPTQQYPTVNGQVFSVTDEEFGHQEVFVAGTSLTGTAINWPTDEIRIVQLNTRGSSLGYYEAFGAGSNRYDNSARMAITNTAFNKNIVVAFVRDENDGGAWGSLTYGSNGSGFQGVEYSGSILNPTPRGGGLADRVAVGIRGDGHVFFYVNGVEQTSTYLDGTLQPMAAFDFFNPASDSLIIAGQLGPMTSSSSMVPFTTSTEGELITTGFVDTYPANVRDWCGNPIS